MYICVAWTMQDHPGSQIFYGLFGLYSQIAPCSPPPLPARPCVSTRYFPCYFPHLPFLSTTLPLSPNSFFTLLSTLFLSPPSLLFSKIQIFPSISHSVNHYLPSIFRYLPSIFHCLPSIFHYLPCIFYYLPSIFFPDILTI